MHLWVLIFIVIPKKDCYSVTKLNLIILDKLPNFYLNLYHFIIIYYTMTLFYKY